MTDFLNLFGTVVEGAGATEESLEEKKLMSD